jgi:hypothetical protein
MEDPAVPPFCVGSPSRWSDGSARVFPKSYAYHWRQEVPSGAATGTRTYLPFDLAM